MTYNSGETPQEGDKVLGPGVKGRVVGVTVDQVVVRAKGPWAPKAARQRDVDTKCDPATLVLCSRAAAGPATK